MLISEDSDLRINPAGIRLILQDNSSDRGSLLLCTLPSAGIDPAGQAATDHEQLAASVLPMHHNHDHSLWG